MKALLRFDLSNYEDVESFDVCLKASSYKRTLEEIYEQVFRARIKYGKDEDKNLSNYELVDKMREEMIEIMKENEVEI